MKKFEFEITDKEFVDSVLEEIGKSSEDFTSPIIEDKAFILEAIRYYGVDDELIYHHPLYHIFAKYSKLQEKSKVFKSNTKFKSYFRLLHFCSIRHIKFITFFTKTLTISISTAPILLYLFRRKYPLSLK